MSITDNDLARGTNELASRDRTLAAIVTAHGLPPMWPIEPGFGGLVNIILGQQVSLASARATWVRLIERIGEPTPARLLELDDDDMHGIGFSRQKTGYARDVARLIIDGALDLDAVALQADNDVRATLMNVRGIGAWSADIYLLMALRRPDIWPTNDLALITATREAYELAEDADNAAVAAFAETWRPWRSVAARILWMDYLRKRGRDI